MQRQQNIVLGMFFLSVKFKRFHLLYTLSEIGAANNCFNHAIDDNNSIFGIGYENWEFRAVEVQQLTSSLESERTRPLLTPVGTQNKSRVIQLDYIHVQDIFTALGCVSSVFLNVQHTCSREITTHIKNAYQRKHTERIWRNFSKKTE